MSLLIKNVILNMDDFPRAEKQEVLRRLEELGYDESGDKITKSTYEDHLSNILK